MMAPSPVSGGRGRPTVVVVAAFGLWALLLLIAGAMNAQETWAPVTMATGVAIAICIGACAARGAWLVGLYGGLVLSSGGLAAVGVVMSRLELVGLGLLGAVIAVATLPLALALWEARPGATTSAPAASNAASLEVLRQIHDHTMLSDNAKRVLFRGRELDLLRETIAFDIADGKYDVAITLCDEMADVFGEREEAEAFRARILRARHERYEGEAAAAVARLDEHLAQRDWGAAHREAASIRRLYGDAVQAQGIDERIAHARDEHKRELEHAFLDTAQRGDVERAMSLLRELDRYLDRDEADRLAEVAQGVVVRHRDNLGVQFKLAVNDHRWAEAARIGQILMEEFPNTKMAGEVRSMIDLIRTRATEAAVARDGGESVVGTREQA